jgi:hypothetical protein
VHFQENPINISQCIKRILIPLPIIYPSFLTDHVKITILWVGLKWHIWTSNEGEISQRLQFFMQVLLVICTFTSLLEMWLQWKLWILRNISAGHAMVPQEVSLLFKYIPPIMWRTATTFTLFITNKLEMVKEYSGKIPQIQPICSSQVTQLFK